MSDTQAGKVVVPIEADTQGFGAKVKEAQVTIDNFGKSVKASFESQTASVFKGIAAYDLLKKSIGEVKDFLVDSIKESMEAARVMAQVATNVKNAGFSYDDLKGKIEATSKAALQLGFDDEAAAESLSKFLLVTKDMATAQGLQNLAMDVARSKNVDLATANKLVTLVTQGQTKALKEYGIELSDTASAADNLDSLQKQVKGSAEAFAKTSAGQLEIVKNQWANIKQEVGDKLVPVLAKLFAQFEKHLPQIEKGVGMAADAVGILADALIKGLPIAVDFVEVFATFQAVSFVTNTASMAAGIGKIGGAIKTLTTLMLANPIGAIAAAAAGAAILIKNSTDKLTAVNDDVATTAQSATEHAQALADAYNKVHNTKLTAKDFGAQDLEITTNWLGIATAGIKTYATNTAQMREAQKLLTKETKATGDAAAGAFIDMNGLSHATQEGANAADKAVTDFANMKKQLLDSRDAARELSKSIGEDLTKAFTDFKSSLKDDVASATKDLTGIALGAEKDLADLQKQLAAEQAKATADQSAENIKQFQDEIAQKKAILASAASFQADALKEQARVQAEIDAATKAQATETDPAKKAALDAQVEGLNAQVVALQGFAEFDKQLADARKLAGEDDFKQAEINTFAKIELATKLYIEETTKLRQKLAVANDVESQITAFYQAQTSLRQATVDAFALATIAQLNAVGDAAKQAMSALSALQSQQSRVATPAAGGLAGGGFARGGEIVHGGELVVPRWIVQRLPALMGQLEAMRSGKGDAGTFTKTITAPISIKANVSGDADVRRIGAEMQFRLNNL